MRSWKKVVLWSAAIVGVGLAGHLFGGKLETVVSRGTGARAGATEGPRLDVPLWGDSRGAAAPLVELVVFSDFQCPFCQRAANNVRRLEGALPGVVRSHFMHFPLPSHPDAPLAAEAALAAGAQGKFWAMHDSLFERQGQLGRPDLERHAAELGLDVARFRADLDARSHRPRVQRDIAAGQKIGVKSTPMMFLNGRPVRGGMPYDSLAAIVADEAERARKLGSAAIETGAKN